MPVLHSRKQEKFCQLIAQGEPGSRAYSSAYGMANLENAKTAASRLRAENVNVNPRIDEIRAKIDNVVSTSIQATALSACVDRFWIIEKLRENVLRSLQLIPPMDDAGNVLPGVYRYDGAVANRSLELLGKEIGMFRERLEIFANPKIQETMNAMGADVRAVILGLDLPAAVKDQVLDALARKWTERLRPLLESGSIVVSASRVGNGGK